MNASGRIYCANRRPRIRNLPFRARGAPLRFDALARMLLEQAEQDNLVGQVGERRCAIAARLPGAMAGLLRRATSGMGAPSLLLRNKRNHVSKHSLAAILGNSTSNRGENHALRGP